jgi:VWFA-related protein
MGAETVRGILSFAAGVVLVVFARPLAAWLSPEAAVRAGEQDSSRATSMTEAEAVQIEREAGGIDHPMRDAILGAACSASTGACDQFTVALLESKARYVAGSARSSARSPLLTLAALSREVGRLPGRKTLLFFSDGFASEETEADIRAVIGEAARSSVVIYTLDTRGLDRGTASSDIIAGVVPKAGGYGALTSQMMLDAGQDAPTRLATATGGLAVRNENDFSRALREIADDTSSYYVLGYRLTNAAFDGRLHTVTVRVNRPGLAARARRSYVALEPAPAPAHEPMPTSAVAPMPSGTAYRLASPHPEQGESVPRSESPGPVIPSLLVPTGSMPTILTGTASALGIHLRPPDYAGAADAERLRTFRAAPGTRPEWPPPLAEQARVGWAAYERGDTKAAREALAGPAAHEAAPPWVHYVLGWAAFAEGGFAQSRNEWNTVRTQVPDFEPVYFDIADAYLRDRKAREALVMMQDAERRWPSSADVLNAVGVLCTSLGDLDQAVVTFERARKAAPEHAEAAFNLAAASEIRYVASIRPNGAAEHDRSRAVEAYRAVLDLGGPLADSSRAGLERLEPLDVTRVTCSAPARIAALGRSQLNGTPSQLAWSPDGRYIYVGAVVPGYGADEHVVLSVADGRVTPLRGRPDWAEAYWRWKAAQQAPWLPAVRITAETKRMTAFNSVDGGDVNRAYAPAGGQSMSNVLTLHGQVIGEASGGAVVAGVTFGWAPFAIGAVAFADPRGRLVLMDVEGRKLGVEGTAGVRLPAWSLDARQVAFLRREGNAHVVYVVQVSGRQPGREVR